jgi:hypothetical protein
MERNSDVTVRPDGESPSSERPEDRRHVNGKFAAGNTAAMTHGAFSRQVRGALLPEQSEALAALDAERRLIEDDLGGAESLSVLTRDLVTRYQELSLVADHLGRKLVTEGPLTTKGHQRAALTAYLSVVDRLHRLAIALGLERKAKRVPSLTEVMRGE